MGGRVRSRLELPQAAGDPRHTGRERRRDGGQLCLSKRHSTRGLLMKQGGPNKGQGAGRLVVDEVVGVAKAVEGVKTTGKNLLSSPIRLLTLEIITARSISFLLRQNVKLRENVRLGFGFGLGKPVKKTLADSGKRSTLR